MQFLAHLRRHSLLDKTWKAHRRLGGTINGTYFHLNGTFGGGRYEANEVNTDYLTDLQNNPLVVVESLSNPPKEIVVALTQQEPTTEPEAVPEPLINLEPPAEPKRKPGRPAKATADHNQPKKSLNWRPNTRRELTPAEKVARMLHVLPIEEQDPDLVLGNPIRRKQGRPRTFRK